MKNLSKLLFCFLAVISFSCNEEDTNTTPVVKSEQELQGAITTNTILKANTVYTLKGFVYVEDGTTLTIEPGTIIKGGPKAGKGTLIIKRGGKIMAEGTKEKPIVFTSSLPKGSRAPGDWGGIIITGKARHNQSSDPLIEGGPQANYGGTDNADNSGILKYVRIEFAGVALEPEKEINGLTMGSVGSGTQIDYVQVSYGGDDAFEWFGGTVNPKHLIAFKTTDDMFDSDYGFTGKVQYALGISDPALSDLAGASNGFESDNDNSGSTNQPLTTASFANVTLVGPISPASGQKFGQGAHLKKGTSLSMNNTVITGWDKAITIDGVSSEGYATNGSLNAKNIIVSGTVGKTGSSAFNANAWFTTAAFNNQTKTHAELGLGTTAPYMPVAGSILLTGGTNVPGFENTTFRGAFGSTNWAEGWTNFDPQNTDY
ncbi:MAG: hypothetical protein JWQ14_2774 [Adhaeribacter sp.]|nr:hypothetical protein [Adhaeribacter sp.]